MPRRTRAQAESSGMKPQRVRLSRGEAAVPTELVLIEWLNAFSRPGPLSRDAVLAAQQALVRNRQVAVVWQSQRLFRAALEHFSRHSDKAWSLTDCTSFVVMARRDIRDAL